MIPGEGEGSHTVSLLVAEFTSRTAKLFRALEILISLSLTLLSLSPSTLGLILTPLNLHIKLTSTSSLILLPDFSPLQDWLRFRRFAEECGQSNNVRTHAILHNISLLFCDQLFFLSTIVRLGGKRERKRTSRRVLRLPDYPVEFCLEPHTACSPYFPHTAMKS